MRIIIGLLCATLYCYTEALPADKYLFAACGTPAIKPDTSSDIVGGKVAIPYSWPWQVFLGGCGGTLVSNEWVLTAAHCAPGMKGSSIKLGVYNKTSNAEPGETIIKVSEVHVHPKYSSTLGNYDAALLKLATPVTFTDHISPICIPTTQDEDLPPADSNVFIIGWGNTKAPSSVSSIPLKQALVPLVAQEQCIKRLKINALRFPFDEKTEICVGFDKGGTGACHGDSGGPALVQNADGTWKQIGITSWVRDGICASPNYSVYAKVAAFVDFIKEYVKN